MAYFFDPNKYGYPDEEGFEKFFKSEEGQRLMADLYSDYKGRIAENQKNTPATVWDESVLGYVKNSKKAYAHRGYPKGFDPRFFTGASESEMIEKAQTLATMIDEAFMEAQRSYGQFGNSPSVRFSSNVKVKKTRSNKTYYNVNIEYSETYLKRDSLTGDDGKPIGSGLYDIYGFFVNFDNSNQKNVRGFWENAGTYIRYPYANSTIYDSAKKDFVVEVVQEFLEQNPGVSVTIPGNWSLSGETVFSNV